HTRLQGDWSSDVCSSDLVAGDHEPGGRQEAEHPLARVPGADLVAAADRFDDAPVLLQRPAARLVDEPDQLPDERGAVIRIVEHRSEERRVGKGWRAGGGA